VDIFDASEYEFLLSRRAREAIGLALIIGIAFVPPVQRWHLGQIQHHAQHFAREVTSQLTPNTSEPPTREVTGVSRRRSNG
jgi:hypothetical protein